MQILHIVLNEFVNDRRVERAVGVAGAFGTVHVYALHREGLPEAEERDGYRLRRFRLRTRHWSKNPIVQLVKYAELFLRVVVAARRLKPALVHGHDLNALPIAAVAARVSNARLIYDSHELWSGAVSMERLPGWMQRAGIWLERSLARRADGVITVSGSFADVMTSTLGIERPTLVRNVPEYVPPLGDGETGTGPLRRALGLTPSVPILLYQGGMMRRRGLPLLVNAMTQIRHASAVLVFLGDGPMVDPIKTMVADQKLEHRISFHPAVPPEVLDRYTQDATIGVFALEGQRLSYRLTLPNKVFEFIQAGLPLVVTDMPEMERIVRDHGVGEVVPDGRADVLAQTLDDLLADPARLERYRQASRAAARELCWENEQQVLRDLYRRLLPNATA